MVIGGGREDLALASWDDGVARDEFSHDTTGGFNTEGERVDIYEDNITQTLIASQDTTLDCSTVSNGLIRVDALGRLLSKVLFEELLDLGNASRTTDEDDLENR